MSQPRPQFSSFSWITGRGASVIALTGFMGVSIFATAMGFQDLRLANLDQPSLGWREALPVWGMTVFVILAMVAALNAALGVGFSPEADGRLKKRIGLRFLAAAFYIFFAFWSVGLAMASSGKSLPDRSTRKPSSGPRLKAFPIPSRARPRRLPLLKIR